MALGLCLYSGEKKYDAALKEFEFAAATSPSNAEIYHYVGGIYRRQGRWREAVASYERALSLDPRNVSIANFAGNNHLYMRDWAAAAAGYNHALEISPITSGPKIGLAYLEVFRNNNPAAGRRILQNIPASLDSDGEVALARWDLAMLERDYAAAEKILTDSPLEDFPQAGDAPKTFYQGRTALARGDIESAQRYFAAAAPSFRKAGARRSRRCRASCPTRITLRLHAEEGGCHSRKSSGRRTRARKPGRISRRICGGQSGAGLCTRWRTGPGDHADRASPFHSRPGHVPGYSAEHHAGRASSALGVGLAAQQSALSKDRDGTRAKRNFALIAAALESRVPFSFSHLQFKCSRRRTIYLKFRTACAIASDDKQSGNPTARATRGSFSHWRRRDGPSEAALAIAPLAFRSGTRPRRERRTGGPSEDSPHGLSGGGGAGDRSGCQANTGSLIFRAR